ADKGSMTVTPDERYLVFDLYDGYSYVEDVKGENIITRPLTRMKFAEQTMRFDLSAFAFNKSDKEQFKGSYQMMNVRQLSQTMDTLKFNRDIKVKEFKTSVNSHFPVVASLEDKNLENCISEEKEYVIDFDKLSNRRQKDIKRVALHSARVINEDIAMYAQILQNDQEYINRHGIEWHQKFTLSIACFVLFLIGAPFGSIVRKGGLGLPLVASVVFFVLYYVINTICIKAIRETAMPPYGMWISTLAMLPLGIFLTLKATTDSAVFDMGSWKKLIRKIFKKSDA
ncbi:MAG: LptF/LptG family permease, partial [Bacteroidales bacterium]|nr:LptF/LptG family permease [Bacteroidales bacterium]